jgi:hypothetical protein
MLDFLIQFGTQALMLLGGLVALITAWFKFRSERKEVHEDKFVNDLRAVIRDVPAQRICSKGNGYVAAGVAGLAGGILVNSLIDAGGPVLDGLPDVTSDHVESAAASVGGLLDYL